MAKEVKKTVTKKPVKKEEKVTKKVAPKKVEKVTKKVVAKIEEKVVAEKPKAKVAKKREGIPTSWLVIATIIVCLAIAIFTTPPQYELKEINTQDFKNLYNSSERSVIMIGRPSCSYCVKFIPVVKKVAAKYDLEVYYYNMDDNIASDEELAEFRSIDPLLQTEWGTPLTVITDNKKLDPDKFEGYSEAEGFIQYLRENEMIK